MNQTSGSPFNGFLVPSKEQSNYSVILNEGHRLLYHDAQPNCGFILAVCSQVGNET